MNTRALLLATLVFIGPVFAAQVDALPLSIADKIAALEKQHGGRLGVTALDGESGARIHYRPDERFAMCSTFKFLLAAAVLARVDARKLALDQQMTFGKADLLDYAPVTKARLGDGAMSIDELCLAAIAYSDNTAANLLIDLLGGPGAVTAFARSLGDHVTRLDRKEPMLNTNEPHDLWDTTSPLAMAETMKELFTGRFLSPASLKRLEEYLLATVTGEKRLRAGIPSCCRVGDKTGTGRNGSINDIAVIRPKPGQMIFVTVYYSESTAPIAEREAVIAEVGKLIAAEFIKCER